MHKSVIPAVIGLSLALAACGTQPSAEVSSVGEPYVYEIVETFDDMDTGRSTVEPAEYREPSSGQGASVPDPAGQVSVLAEYPYSDELGWYSYRFYVVRNDSDETLDISVSSLAYDADANLVAADDSSEEAVGPGCVTLIYSAFDTDSEVASCKSEWSAKKDTANISVLQDLDYEISDIRGGISIQVTNSGDITAQFVFGYALFFDGDELVDYEWVCFTDDDNEIKPGETVSKQMSVYDDFDAVEFYMTGRHSRSSD